MEQDEDGDAKRRALSRNPALVCAYHAVHMSLFPIAIITLFMRDDLGLSMLEVFLLQAIFGLALGLAEFPGGYVADRIGYRRSMAVGALLASSGWFIYVLADGFLLVAVAEVVMAVGIALISGADTALMYESLLATDDEGSYTHWYSRYRFFGNVGEGTAALVGALLYSYMPRVPLAIQGVLWALNVFIALRLLEPDRDQGAARCAGARVVAILRFATVESPRLRALIALSLTLCMPTYVMVWILPAYTIDGGVAASYMGPIWAGASYLVALASLASPRVRERLGLTGALSLCVGLIAVGYLGLGLTHAWYGFLFHAALCVTRGIQSPLLQHEEQRVIPSSDRASLLSLKNLAFRLSFVALAPMIGHALDEAGHHTVLLTLALPFTLAASLALLTLQWSRAPNRATPVPIRPR
ncbi:MAG: MFS transporter [Myxococcales bacterium]|nr:MFS transporter [Myxococcales bacterium]